MYKGCLKCRTTFNDEANETYNCPECFSEDVITFEEALELSERYNLDIKEPLFFEDNEYD